LFINIMQFNLAVKAIIRKDDKILIVKRSPSDDHKPGVWETPGGRIEEKSDPKDALLREVKEETGLEVIVGQPFNIFHFTKDTGEFVVGMTFLCDYAGGEVRLSDEHDEYQWIWPGDFKNYESTDSLHAEIEKYSGSYFGNYERFMISLVALIVKDEKCLILKDNKYGKWVFPGGRADVGETGDIAFKRELKEEIGLEEFIDLGVADYDIWYTQKFSKPMCGIVHLVEADVSDFELTFEHSEAQWVTLEESEKFEFIGRRPIA